MFASAMLAADPVVSDVYYAGDHFVPYTGAKPAGKGRDNKRGRAERGRADTHVTAHDGRAVCFVTGDPSVTLPKALAELKEAVPGGTRIMLGSGRGGACPAVFTHCRGQNVHWVTYRRAPLAIPAMLPVITTVTVGGKSRQITWAEEKVQVKDYGEARQLTLSEHGRVVLQVLTSDFDACPADILSWLKSRAINELAAAGRLRNLPGAVKDGDLSYIPKYAFRHGLNGVKGGGGAAIAAVTGAARQCGQDGPAQGCGQWRLG